MDRPLHGRALGLAPGRGLPVRPGQYSPRLLVYENVGFQFCGEQSFCAGVLPSSTIDVDFGDEYEQPLAGPVFEAIGYFAVEDTAGISAATLAHEFGHFVDNFADPGTISAGFGCQNCAPSCEPDTTDESAPLVESFASFTALWLLRDLYAVGQSPTSCAVPLAVSKGGSSSPHVEGCTDGGSDIALFLPTGAPECAGFTCDALDAGDTTATTGICNPSPGYRIGSFYQALWEAMHAHTCAVSAPYSCVSRPALVSEPAGDIVGGALLYALRVNTATYRGFADDMATHVACNHGEAAYQAFNEILCHHKIRDCDAPTPALCETCGNRIREGQEACDGTDLGGQTCENLGFEGGSLMCDMNCSLDDSGCVNNIPTTGADPPEPTSDGLSETGIVLDSDTAGGGVADDGCGCRSAPSASWLTALLSGALLRRRRRSALGFAAACSLFTVQAGCGPETPTNEGTESGTSGSSTGPAMSTGDGPGEVSARMFGKFHYDVTDAGITVSAPPGGSWFVFPWSTLQVERDGSVTVWRKVCEDQVDVQKFDWVHVRDDVLQIVPDEYKSNGTFRWKADDVVAVTLTPGPGCDDLHEVIEYLPDSGKSTRTMRHLPGDICTEDDTPEHPEDCNFTFVWCEEGAPPACTADAP